MSWLLKPSLEDVGFGGNGTSSASGGKETSKKENLALAAVEEKSNPRFNLSLGWISSISLFLLLLALLLGRREPTVETSPPRPPPPSPPPLPPSSLDELRGVVDGNLLLPGQPQYEQRRQVRLFCQSQN